MSLHHRLKICFSFYLLLILSCSSAQPGDFPYSLSKKDYLFTSISTVSFVSSKVLENNRAHNITPSQISGLNRNTINRFDRNATFHWNRSADKFSDRIYNAMPFVPLTLAIPQLKKPKWKNVVTLGVMYSEVFLLTNGLTGITKSLTGRIRPYLYNTSFSVEERFNFQSHEAPMASTSFFSGHCSGTFAFAVFLSKTYTDIYGKGPWSKIIWATSLTLASATAVCRVAAGEHFPTDVMVGSLVGATVGYSIPALHKLNSEKLSMMVLPTYFRISYRL